MKVQFAVILIISFFSLTESVVGQAVHTIFLHCAGITPSNITAVCNDTVKFTWNGCADTTESTSIPACASPWSSPMDVTTFIYEMIVPCAGTYNFEWRGDTGVINATCAVGIAKNSEVSPHISFYPNPYTTEAVLRTDEMMYAADLRIYNMLGREVCGIENISGQTVRINRENMPSGSYFYILKENNITLAIDQIVITNN